MELTHTVQTTTYVMRDGTGLGNARSSKAKLFGLGAEDLGAEDMGGLSLSARLGGTLGTLGPRSSDTDRDFFNGLETAEASICPETMLSAGLTSRGMGVAGSSPICRNRKRGLGNMNASHQVSADSQLVLVFTCVAC